MKGAITVLGQLAGREAAARLVDGRLEELLLEAGAAAPGTLWRGKLGRPVKGLGGAFVDLPDGQRGFLRQPKGLRPGQTLVVQAAGVAEPGKAVALTDRITLKGRLAVLTPGVPGVNVARGLRDDSERARLTALAEGAMDGAPADCGVILRSAAEGAEASVLEAEIAQLRVQAAGLTSAGPVTLLQAAPGPHAVARRDWPAADALDDGPQAFADHGVEALVAALLAPEHPLGDGAAMAIEPTRALVAVDVNTGTDMSPAAGLKANLAAVRALPRALRLLGLGGQVVVDFAPMPKRDRGTLEQSLRAAIRREGEGLALVGWTPLGHAELQRRRDRPPLAALLGGGRE